MPLAVQALLPLAVLLAAAALIGVLGRRANNGWVAFTATAAAAVIALIELLRLAPGEHVDVPYLTTFPFAALTIRLDGLSLAFVSVTLATAALSMLARQQDREDRRDPWMGWLLTSAAVCAVMLAANVLLLYILMQLLTLAWSGALDETARRRRGLRLALQIGDIGLLLAAAGAIQSVGTSSFSGVPSDTFGLASFSLMLLPVLVRLAALAWAARRPLASVAFGPAIAWLAPGAYLLLRVLALMGGRLPDRPSAVVLFGGGALAAIALGTAAIWGRSIAQVMALLVGAQAALALGLSSGSDPLLTIACTWLWLMLIPVAGLASLRMGPVGEAITLGLLTAIPGTVAFVGVWLSGLALNATGLLLGVIPVGLAVLACATAGLSRITMPRSWRVDISAVWAGVTLLIAAFPIMTINPFVIPAASTVRLVPRGTVSANPLGLTTPFGSWPALAVSLIVLVGLATIVWLRGPSGTLVPALPRPAAGRVRLSIRIPALSLPLWAHYIAWAALIVVVGVASVRP
ncbi:MAG TPA: hypothetical protein VFR68_04875 [Candidatus Dormibacteraeota bacterium]|nr:hypothetical protein [Candidatus Dormibacteraeota bacterium]